MRTQPPLCSRFGKRLWPLLCGLLTACTPTFPQGEALPTPPLFPDYNQVCLPPNIAAPAFAVEDSLPGTLLARFETPVGSYTLRGRGNQIRPNLRQWKRLLQESAGDSLFVHLARKTPAGWRIYAPFPMQVATEPIDPYLVYRRIEPGYETWHEMGLYQRRLTDYRERTLVANRMLEQNCVNCHSFRDRDPETLLFHVRGSLGATYLVDDKGVEKLHTKTPQTRSNLVYPAWHPQGRWIAFSVNDTKQYFHLNHPNRIEVADSGSDIVVYDRQNHQIRSCPQLFSEEAFETFPTFSPDGKTLFFCTARARAVPQDYQEVRYSLCALAFDPAQGTFGSTVDTLVPAARQGKSVSFPRVSPDGRFLLYTLSDYGNFSIWHQEADLHLLDLATGEALPAQALNSPGVESYHSWSGNSRWVVLSSRRQDGLYTRPYIGYIDAFGRAAKPFALPQRQAYASRSQMQSYNIPEFTTGPVKAASYKVSRASRQEGRQLEFCPL